MTTEFRPGMRLLLTDQQGREPGTLSAVVTHGAQTWGLTAGHVLGDFADGTAVTYFPDELSTEVGHYIAPTANGPGMDLGKLRVSAELALDLPVGFGRSPEVWPDALGALTGKPLVFLGGQVGRVDARVLNVSAVDDHPHALIVQLDKPELKFGDSGGPLYWDAVEALFWVGTLVEERTEARGATTTEGVFLHPGLALQTLQLASNGSNS